MAKDETPKVVERVVERVVIQAETTEQRLQREAKERRDAERAKALEGLVFPLRVRCTAAIGYPRVLGHPKPVEVRKGDVFTVARAEDYSHKWMTPVAADTPDQVQQRLDQAPKRPKRSGEDGDPSTPSWQDSPRAATSDKSTSVI